MSVQFAPLPETDPAAKNSSPNEDCGTLSADLSQAILLRDSSYYFLDVIFRVSEPSRRVGVQDDSLAEISGGRIVV